MFLYPSQSNMGRLHHKDWRLILGMPVHSEVSLTTSASTEGNKHIV